MADRYQEREARWSEELYYASLILQVNYDDDEARDSLQLIGYRLNCDLKHVVRRDLLASLLVGINCLASAEYEQGQLWPKIMGALKFKNTQNHRALVGSLYREGLEKFKLERFEHPLPNIGEMLLHAGVPLVSLNRFLARLLRDYQEYPGLSGADFNASIRHLSDHEVQAKSLDKPIWHFVRQAGDFADDFTEKCIEIIDDMRDGTYDEGGGLGLPDRVISRVVQLIKEQSTRASLARGSTGVRIEKPRFVWDEVSTNNELRLQFPQVENKLQRPVSWMVELNEEIASSKTFPSLSGARAANSEFQIKRPSPQIKISPTNEFGQAFSNVPDSWTVPLYQEGSWLLVFDESGNFMPGQGPLQPGIYSVLTPAFLSGFPTEITISGEYLAAEVSPPSGWMSSDPEKSWVAKKLDLINASKISLVAGSEKSRRLVSGLRRPKFLLDDRVVRGLKGTGSAPILNRLPGAVIPASLGADNSWILQVRNEDRTVVHSYVYLASELPIEVDLNSNCDYEFDGTYEVILQGKALGASLRQTFQISTGLTSRSTPSNRKFLSDMSGLDPCEVVLERASRQVVIKLDSGTSFVQNHGSDISRLEFTIEPEHEFIEIYDRSSGARDAWLSSANCHTEDLGNLQLRIHLVEPVIPSIVSRWGRGHFHVLSTKLVGGDFFIELSELKDSANVYGAFEVFIEGYADSSLPALSCYEKQLLERVIPLAGSRALSLEFVGGSVPTNLVAAFYSEFAPWCAPVVQRVLETEIEVPENVHVFGNFFVVFDISDKWAPKVFPDAPNLDDNYFSVRLQTSESDEPDIQLARWFQAQLNGDPPKTIPTDLAWRLLTGEHIKVGGRGRAKVVEYARNILSADKDKSLMEYPASAGGGGSYVKHLFLTGLLDAKNSADDQRFAKFSTRPFLATLALSASCKHEDTPKVFGILADLWGLRLLNEADSPEHNFERAVLEKMLRTKINVLSFVLSPNNIVHPFAKDAERLHDYLEENSLPPGRFLEIGTLVEIFGWMANNAVRLIEVVPISELAKVSEELLVAESSMAEPYKRASAARPILPADLVNGVAGAIKPTINLPAVSIRLALMARLSSRGDSGAAQLWERYATFYQRISESVKGLVEHDLVLAELYLQLEGKTNERD
jgi:hypothetical protein